MSVKLLPEEMAGKIDKIREYGNSKEPISGRLSQKILKELGLRRKGWPRYEPAYYFIKQAFPEFEWKHHSNNGKMYVTFHNISAFNVSLAELVLEAARKIIEDSGEFAGFSPRIEIRTFSSIAQTS